MLHSPETLAQTLFVAARKARLLDTPAPVLQALLRALGGRRAFLLVPGEDEDLPLVAAGPARLLPRARPSPRLVQRVLATPGDVVCLPFHEDSGPSGAPRFHARASALAARPEPPDGGHWLILVEAPQGIRLGEETARLCLRLARAVLGPWLPGNAPVHSLETPQTLRRAREQLVGRSPSLRDVLERAELVASWRSAVLIVGESGTGKDGVARLIHAAGPRASAPFVPVNCAAIPEGLFEAELFGARRGAYSGADRDRDGLIRAADGGTLFLDEIAELPGPLQAKLLRTLQEATVRPLGADAEHPVDVRIVSATNRDLSAMVREGSFREDLYYRLARVILALPPLRERPGDLELVAEVCLARLQEEMGGRPLALAPGAAAVLARHDWPGNVRELESVLARAALRVRGPWIRPQDLQAELEGCTGGSPAERNLEAEMIRKALRQSGGNLTRAAARIGWSRQKLGRRMQALKLRGDAGPARLF